MKMSKLILTLLALFFIKTTFAQTCDCSIEFTHIKDFMEQNYAGFKDKQAQMTKAGYDKLTNEYLNYAKAPHSSEECLLIISQYLDHFKDSHVSIGARFNATKVDSAYISQRQLVNISDKKYQDLLQSKGKEGIYYFNWDTAAYKIAVIKDVTPLHDYVGVLLNSNLPGWKKGVLKLEGKMQNDSTMKGVLYMRNQMPSPQWFTFSKNTIYGDWQRVGTTREKTTYSYVPVASRKLSEKTLYIKISSFSPSNGNNIDSVLKVNADALKTMPYLVLDLRGNGGGSDYTFSPILPYIYTDPIHNIGVDVLSTDANIAGWTKELDDKDMSEDNKNEIKGIIKQMEDGKGKWVSLGEDNVTSDYKKLPNPSKIVILVDKGCASTTEQFLLFARQSSKVILMGQPTSGTLDYSNVREAPFSCMPYVLRYSTTRSRRLDVGQGIDNVGIKPNKTLDPNEDWIKAAMAELEK